MDLGQVTQALCLSLSICRMWIVILTYLNKQWEEDYLFNGFHSSLPEECFSDWTPCSSRVIHPWLFELLPSVGFHFGETAFICNWSSIGALLEEASSACTEIRHPSVSWPHTTHLQPAALSFWGSSGRLFSFSATVPSTQTFYWCIPRIHSDPVFVKCSGHEKYYRCAKYYYCCYYYYYYWANNRECSHVKGLFTWINWPSGYFMQLYLKLETPS